MRGLLQALQRDDRIKDRTNVRPHAFFDVVKVANGDTVAKFFTQGVGQGASVFVANSVKTDSDTNWPQATQLDTGKRFIVGAIQVLLDSTAGDKEAADLKAFLRTAILLVKRAGKEIYGPVPVKLHPGGAGISGFSATTNAATSILAANHGIPDPRAIRGFGELPLDIRQQEKIEVQISWPTGGVALTANQYVYATVVLDGVLQEAI